MKNSIHQLCDELSKLTSFLNSTPVKSAASSTIKFLNQKDTKFPLRETDSPVILGFSMFFTNSKGIKNFNQLLHRLIDCIRNSVFDSDALLFIMNLICTNVSQFDIELSLKLLQYTTSSVLKDFPNLYIINSFFSTALAFLSHPDPVVSGTAYASFQQMLALFIDTIRNFKDINNINYQNYIKYCNEKYGQIMSGFKNPFNVILHLIFCDLTNLSENLKTNWLFMIQTPQETMFVLLAEIVQTYGDIIKEDQQLLSSFRLTIFEDVKYPNAIPYLITYISSFLDVDNTVASTLFSQYFQQIQYNSEMNYAPILFFHYFALQKEDIMLHYFTIWDGALDLFVPLICTLMNFITIPEMPLSFNMKQWKHIDALSDQKRFELIAIHEITFAIITSFKKSMESKVLGFISKSSSALVFIVMSGIKVSNLNTFNVPQQALFDLIQILSKLSLLSKVSKFEDIDSIFNDFSDSQKDFFLYNEKAKLWPKFISNFILESPQVCEDKWKFFINAAIVNEITPTFANKLSNITTMDILYALLSTKPFPNDYISEFIFTNLHRFELLYPIYETYVDKMLQKNRFDEAVLQSYLSLMKKCFSQKTEIELLRTTATFLQSNIPIQHKAPVLIQLKDNISFNFSEIKEGWISLFEAIQPLYFQNDKNLLKIGFDILNSISLDHVPTIYFSQCIESIFEYIEQNTDNSISILGFDLLNKIEKRIEIWDPILIHCAQILTNSFKDAANKACDLFFNILQNHEISPTILTYLFDKGFYEILEALNSSLILPNFLISIAKYICNEWEFLLEHPTFLCKFVPTIIEKQRGTKTNISDFYITFYSSPMVINTSPEVEELLSRSISSRIGQIAAFFELTIQKTVLLADNNDNNSNINNKDNTNINNKSLNDQASSQEYENALKDLNILTELLFQILKQRKVKTSPKYWMPMMAMILLSTPLNSCQSIYHAFQSIPKFIFNEDINDNSTEEKNNIKNDDNINYNFSEKCFIVENLSSIVKRINNNDKRKMLAEVILEIIKKQPRLIFSCHDAFSSKESIPLIELLFKEVECVDKELSNKVLLESSTDSFYSTDDTEKNDEKALIFECLVAALTHKETKEKALEKIVDIFPSLQQDFQKKFIFIHCNDKIIITTIFKSFFDINSTMFNIEVFSNCNLVTFNALKTLIDQSDEEDNNFLLDFYKYLKTVKIPLRIGDKQDEKENPLISALMNSISLKLNLNEDELQKE